MSKRSLSLQNFSDITLKVIRKDGVANYLPTLAFPNKKHVRVIQGIPVGVDHREAIQDSIRKSEDEKTEFFFGVKSAPQEITIGHHRPGQSAEFMTIKETPDGYSVNPLSSCDWWTVGRRRT